MFSFHCCFQLSPNINGVSGLQSCACIRRVTLTKVWQGAVLTWGGPSPLEFYSLPWNPCHSLPFCLNSDMQWQHDATEAAADIIQSYYCIIFSHQRVNTLQDTDASCIFAWTFWGFKWLSQACRDGHRSMQAECEERHVGKRDRILYKARTF